MTVVYSSTPGLDVRLDTGSGVLRLTLDKPDKQNSLDDHMFTGLIRAFETAQQDTDVRAILLAGTGPNFCGGADIVARNTADPDAPKPRTGSIQRRLTVSAHRLIPLMLSTQAPVVCAVQGWVVGVGFHLALASDFCVAAADARFWEPFSTRGFTPDSGGTWLLPRLLGPARAKDLLMLGRRITGEEALAMGLIHSVVPVIDRSDETGGDAKGGDATGGVLAAAEALAQQLAAGSTVALGLTKWLIHTGLGLDLERHLANEAFAMELSSRSPDFREGFKAFREKRDPDFTGM
jgi:2-(1,2-epoxy-1,2-dihydrophenyl)acetyl-CoA isomerase